MKLHIKQALAVTLTLTMVALSGGRANAMLAPAQLPAQTTQLEGERLNDLTTVQTFLERKEVKRHLEKLGLSEDEVQSRLSNLSDNDLHQVASQIQSENPAGDGGGVIVTILVIGILVLLFVYLFKRV
jgi:hypothetical protein